MANGFLFVNASIEGEWQGFYWKDGIKHRLGITINGDKTATANCPDEGELMMPVQGYREERNSIAGELPFIGARFSLHLVSRSGTLSGELIYPDLSQPIRLYRNNPAFRKFIVPRLGSNGVHVRKYAYTPPRKMRDGWAVGHLVDAGLEMEPVGELIERILAGEFICPEAILVVKDGRLVLEEYFHGHLRQDLHGIQSCTKSITSLLFGIARDQGHISNVQDYVYEYFEERKDTRWVQEHYPVRLLHMLSMTASLDWNETLPYSNPKNDNTAMNLSSDWIGYILNKKLVGQQGKKYRYTSGMSILLGAVIRNATGKYVDDFARDALFSPLDIRDFRWACADDGTRHTGGGLSLRARDAAKLTDLILSKGKWKGREVVSPAWILESTRQHTPDGDYPYGYQWHLPAFHANGRKIACIAAAGFGGQWLFHFPEHNLGVVLFSGAYGGDSRPYEKAACILASACGTKPDLVQGV